MQPKPIDDFEDYLIYEDGRVESLKHSKNKIKKPFLNNKGYYMITIFKKGERYTNLVSRLVALHFIPNPENKPEVNHIDNNHKNNHISNLEWCTRLENLQHASKQGRTSRTHQFKGSKHNKAKLKEHMIIIIKKLLDEKELTQKQIGSIFNVGQDIISGIKLNKLWKHV